MFAHGCVCVKGFSFSRTLSFNEKGCPGKPVMLPVFTSEFSALLPVHMLWIRTVSLKVVQVRSGAHGML